MTSRLSRLVDVTAAVGQMVRWQVTSWVSRRPLTGDVPEVVVCMTTYGRRTSFVHLALQSIGSGSARPSRLILFLDDAAKVADPPRGIARLRRRGLEVRYGEDLGPHKKWYPYVTSLPRHTVDMVTADDDTLYPREWLSALRTSVRSTTVPSVHAHRAHRIVVTPAGQLAPYATWGHPEIGTPSHLTFPVGVGGVWYPHAFLERLRETADPDLFMQVTPRADDVWLHLQALRASFPAVWTGAFPDSAYVAVRGTRTAGLLASNVGGGGNDEQITRAYGSADLGLLQGSGTVGPPPSF